MRVFQLIITVLCISQTFAYYEYYSVESDSEENSESDEGEDIEERQIVTKSSKENNDEDSEEREIVSKSSKEQKIKLNDEVSCQSPKILPGVCKHLDDCASILNTLVYPLNDVSKNFIKVSEDICQLKKADGLCCPIDVSYRTAEINKFSENCGLVMRKRYSTENVGGKNSEIGAWPWLALLGYKIKKQILYTCAGSLITNRHVVTAAHCINKALTSVRLGEFDSSNDTETQHIDINIAKAIAHEHFSTYTGKNDLGVLLLEKNVQFTDLISPICLPTSPQLREKSYVGSKPFVAAWGYITDIGHRSVTLQELQISVLDNSVCYEIFKSNDELVEENQFDSSVLCVGDLRGGKDACDGDSGGPIMMPISIEKTLHYYLIGVISYGIGCARKDMTAAFTNVPYHMDWIMRQLVEA